MGKLTGGENLAGVHPDLQQLMIDGAKGSRYDFKITEGVRSYERQLELYKKGKTPVLEESRHLARLACCHGGVRKVSHAVDILVYDERGVGVWGQTYYRIVTDHLKQVAKELGIQATFGIDWPSVDSVHVELAWSDYPLCESREGCCGGTLPDEYLGRERGTGAPESTKSTRTKETDMNGTKGLLQSKGILSLLIAAVAFALKELGIGADAGTVVQAALDLLVALGIGGGLFGRAVATQRLQGLV